MTLRTYRDCIRTPPPTLLTPACNTYTPLPETQQEYRFSYAS